jgi:hypothetical protein
MRAQSGPSSTVFEAEAKFAHGLHVAPGVTIDAPQIVP